MGRRVIDELVALADTKKPQGSSRPLSNRTQAQADVAIAEAKRGSAWSYGGDFPSRRNPSHGYFMHPKRH